MKQRNLPSFKLLEPASNSDISVFYMQKRVSIFQKSSPLRRPFWGLCGVFFAMVAVAASGETSTGSSNPASANALEPAKFTDPEPQYRPIDCWWWDGAPLDRDRLRQQMED